MQTLRTPPERFLGLPDYPFAEHYAEVPAYPDRDGAAGGQRLRVHYVDEGDRGDGRGASGETVVLLHGQPSWSFLYRRVVPPLVAAGHRVVAPDLVGFGKSDKPARVGDHTYARHTAWLRALLFDALALRDVTLYAQDWGGLLSLRLVASEPERFARVMVANTGLPVAERDSNFTPGDAPRKPGVTVGATLWKTFARWTPVFPIGRMAQALASESALSPEVRAGYDAPFPDRRYLAGPRAMPSLIPMTPGAEPSRTNREAWRRLAGFERPFRTAFSDKDFALRFLPVPESFQRHVAGAAGQRHVTIEGAGHFLQEDAPEAVAREINAFIAETP